MAKRDTKPIGRLVHGAKALLTSDKEADRMRNKLLEAKQLFLSNIPLNTKKLCQSYYEDRINTLPKGMLHDSFDDLSEYHKLKGTKEGQLALMYFVGCLALTFSYKGWLRKRV